MNVQKGLGDTSIRYKELDWNWKTMRAQMPLRIPPLRDLFLMSTLNTWRTCQSCYGYKWNEIHHSNGAVTIKTCQKCKGKGVTKN